MDSLKTKYFLSILLLINFLCFRAQTIELPYSAAGITWYSGHLYCYGLEETNKDLTFSIQQLDINLNLKSTKNIKLSYQKIEENVPCWSDTLHGTLNVYLAEGKNQKVSVFRFKPTLELISQNEGVEVSRLNTLSGFDNELFYEKSNVYVIKTKSDSSGKQFYLNKYTFQEELGGLEYKLNWQFPFERQNISSARVFYANQDMVVLFVMVKAGEKTGQWILKVNAKTGHLIKGTKLNNKGDENTYCFGNYYFESTNKTLLICGHKFAPKQLAAETEVLSVSGATAVNLYISEIDSLGVQIIKQEVKLPIVPVKSGVKTKGDVYLLQIPAIQKMAQNQYQLEVDVYKKPGSVTCYTYANSFKLAFRKEDENYLFEKKTIFSDPLIESYLFTNDKLDMNGKICQDSSTSLSKLFYKRPSLAIKLKFEEDSLKRPMWWLSKSTIRKGSINYTQLRVGKKNYELKLLEDIQKSSAPIFVALPGNTAVIGRQNTPSTYKLVLYK